MLTSLLILVLATSVDLGLVLLGVGRRRVILGNALLIVSVFLFCVFRGTFDLGPHIELAGWIVGAYLGALLATAVVISFGMAAINQEFPKE